MKKEFETHFLNDQGRAKAIAISKLFNDLLENLEILSGSEGREISIVKTKLEEACFFAKKAMALNVANQQGKVE